MAKRSGKKKGSARKRSRAPPPKLSFFDLYGRTVAYVVVFVVIIVAIALAVSLRVDDEIDGDGNGNGPDDNTNYQPAPNFQVISVEGDPVALEMYRGKVVVLDLFATWCGPCRTQMEELNKLRAAYPEEQVVILSIDVDTDETEQMIRDFRDQYNADWTFALDTDDLGGKYQASSIPTMAIITKDGKLAWRHAGVTTVSELKDRIDPLL
jgi:thiol-disulfide isomerase/thioredoxin